MAGELQAGPNKLKLSASMEGQNLEPEVLVEKISDEFGHRISPKKIKKSNGRRQSAQTASQTVDKITSKMEKNLIILKTTLEG